MKGADVFLIAVGALLAGYFIGGVALGWHIRRCCGCRQRLMREWPDHHGGLPCPVPDPLDEHVAHPRPPLRPVLRAIP